MADVSSLGQYKVVVTADYSQLKSQFEAMTKLVQDTTKAMAESIDKSMGAMNTAMNTQLKSMVTSMQNAFSGADTTVKSFGESVTKAAGETAKAGETVRKGGEGFKTYAQQVREAEREVQKSYQTLQDLQNKLQIVRNTPAKTSSDYLYRQNEEQKIEAAIRAQQAEYDRLRQKLDQLKATQEQYKNSVNQTAIAAKQAERALVQGAKDEQNLMRQNARLLEGEVRSRTQGEAQVNRVQQQTANAQSRRIAHLQTQYRVAYEEANKYLQTHAKMSEAVFIRLQGRLTAIGNEIRRLGAMPPMTNPLEGMNYEQYVSGFSKLEDVLKSVKHHLMWMASAAVIAAGFGIPAGVSKAIEAFDALQTKIMQNMELANQYDGNSQKLHTDMNRMGEAAKTMAQGFGVSLNEVQEGMQIVTRRFKDADTAIYLTSIALQMSKLDMVDVKQSAKDLEAVMLQFGMGAKDAGKFLNDFSVICHVARISGTDMLMALERSGSAFKAMNMDARAAMAAIAAVSTVTGKSGATIGDSWKSILANMDFKKATAALEAYNIKLYEVGQNGAKTMRSGTAVLSEILATYQKLDDEGRRKLATAIAGGRRKLAA